MSKLAITFVFLALFLSLSPLQATLDLSGFCAPKCQARCAKASVVDRCLKYCGICCVECKCVPSGTYGNKHECPCYRDKLSKKGKPKCP
ncbi:peamaclein-like [Magnolia sinica]|uniref:peamaclein-like n=1 Tax=Magnolia sinica TaxID=86752 RepID=UPI0026588D93|nr:peamaclein-like [Magnolia sinica]